MPDTTSSGSIENSEKLFRHALERLPGGVSSPVRAFRHVGGTPIFMRRGQGAMIFDEDGNGYLDFCLAWGPLILGHAHPAVIEAVTRAVHNGLAFGTCHRFESELAEKILEAFAYAERVRFVVSGTEAVLTAVRLARAVTKRRLLLKFSGCYHGHVDALLVKAGSGVITQGLADSAGVTDTVAKDTLVLPLGDEAAIEEAFQRFGSEIAAVILEPLPANNGLLIQSREWLKKLRTITQRHGALLIFDEVITGFRFGYHGYAKVIDVTPDLTTLGKIVGGGLPVGAVVGPSRILDELAPLGSVYQAGTMAGNPVALAAGLATLETLRHKEIYRHLEVLGQTLEAAVKRAAVPALRLARVGSVFWLYLDDAAPPTTAEAISKNAVQRYRQHYQDWLRHGIYLAPSAYEVGFLSAAHQPAEVERMVHVVATSLSSSS